MNGKEELVNIPFANNVWPRERYRSIEDGEYGYRFLYLDERGVPQHAKLSAGASTDSSIARKACSDLAAKGVPITPDSRGLMGIALGHWNQRMSPPIVTLVETSGWHSEKVYVNGDVIFGAPGWHVDEGSPAIVNRTGRGGTLEG